jgi:hypothetical protein
MSATNQTRMIHGDKNLGAANNNEVSNLSPNAMSNLSPKSSALYRNALTEVPDGLFEELMINIVEV